MQRSPFILDVADLLGNDASTRTVDLDVTVDWGMEMTRVDAGTPLSATLTLHPVSGGVAVTGSARFTTIDTCYRCLDEFTTERATNLGALFDRSGDEEAYPLEGHTIDVEQLLRDEVLLGLPLVEDCGPECAGVVNSAGNDLNTGSSGDEGDSRSPFAVLKDLLDTED